MFEQNHLLHNFILLTCNIMNITNPIIAIRKGKII